MKNLVAFVGFKGSGKNTAAIPLLSQNYVSLSFADALKDALSAIFCWDRQMLEGVTAESRHWREQVDAWWAEKLEIPNFTPRWAMTNFGTDVMRKHFHDRLWIFNIERRMMLIDDQTSVALIDCRFPNEISMARAHGGRIIRIKRGDDPHWAWCAKHANHGSFKHRAMMKESGIHESEWAWMSSEVDVIIDNDGTIEEFHEKVLSALN